VTGGAVQTWGGIYRGTLPLSISLALPTPHHLRFRYLGVGTSSDKFFNTGRAKNGRDVMKEWMAKILGSKIVGAWKLYAGVVAVGFALWILAVMLAPAPDYGMLKSTDRSLTMVPASKPIYQEVRFWAETVGKLLVGIGGIASAVRAILELLKRRWDK
jgi:hypothetical protein